MQQPASSETKADREGQAPQSPSLNGTASPPEREGAPAELAQSTAKLDPTPDELPAQAHAREGAPDETPAAYPMHEESECLMTVVEHLDELRTRLLRCLAALVIAVVVALFIAKHIVRFLEAPAGNITFQALSLEEPLIVYFKVAFYTGLVLAAPWLLFEASQFVGPGLRSHERRVLMPIVIGGPALFVCGAAFAYYCVLPPMLHFFGTFGEGISPIHQRLDFYISLVTSVLLYMGLCFQLPIVIFALSFTGLVNSSYLLKFWKYAVFGASVVAAIITPDPTAFSMLIVMGALVGLYFLSVLLLKLFGR